ncbi:zinc finger protein-like 1 homolog [Onthophagus taurus]|uniref:zinc finger protein-like 1 homolog n=1 Tax=Onthophagus taurus TaxID=166361 RepID=UPI000C1FE886|nr:zinc finger protein-like 1 homolog [Onthophagus taurus]
MGLCKCPKRKVTNQFCFEHRVNVCEHCMVTNHPKCIIQSYLQWLQDSDYNPICELCMKELNLEDCIRLTCYHVFHWSCLDNYSRQLPSTTAPAGYTCPSCRAALFPPSNLVSPVADVLREKLAGVNWARAGLGLPLLSEESELKPVLNRNPAPSISPGPPYSVVHVEDQVSFNRESSDKYQAPARRVFQDIRETRGVVVDHDEDKYKRRPASEWFKRLWKNARNNPRNRSNGSIYKRYFMLTLIIVIAIIVLLLTMSRLSRHSSDNDPLWDVRENPNVHFKQETI